MKGVHGETPNDTRTTWRAPGRACRGWGPATADSAPAASPTPTPSSPWRGAGGLRSGLRPTARNILKVTRAVYKATPTGRPSGGRAAPERRPPPHGARAAEGCTSTATAADGAGGDGTELGVCGHAISKRHACSRRSVCKHRFARKCNVGQCGRPTQAVATICRAALELEAEVRRSQDLWNPHPRTTT